MNKLTPLICIVIAIVAVANFQNPTPTLVIAKEPPTDGLMAVNTDLLVQEIKGQEKPLLEEVKSSIEGIKLEALAFAPIVENKGSITATIKTDWLKENYLKNKTIYSSDKTCHPYIIASIHYRETNFGTSNAWNGQGAFQNLGNRYAGNSEVSDWTEQVKQACEHLKWKVKAQDLLNIHDEDVLPTALARYNGCAGLNWKKCSYVSNQTNLMSTGLKCAVDGCAYKVQDRRSGALSIIKQLIEMNI